MSDSSSPARPAPQAVSLSDAAPASRERPANPDSYVVDAIAETADHAFHSALARWTGGLSPAGLSAAYFDWLTHLALSPGKQLQLSHKASKKLGKLIAHFARRLVDPDYQEGGIQPLPQDHRFDAAAWSRFPYDLIYQSFLFTQQWWHNASTGVRGVAPHHERVVDFAGRQLLDVMSPSNFLWTNPELIDATIAQGGMNLVRGARNFLEDAQRMLAGRPPAGVEAFRVGEELAATQGKVVFRNRLIELLRYEPTTETVHPEPLLIVPAWIMKYYILDLAPGKSLVEYLTAQGFTVFIISWRNPGPEDRDLSFDDYRRLGVMAALEVVQEQTGARQVHGAGYCLGGTLLAIAAAAMARDGDDRFASLTMLAAQVDFEEAGELTLFIDESQVAFLEDQMWRRGYLDASQMAGAFQLLRSNDLIWSRMQREYLLGERSDLVDMMAWNADSTRMPYRMHSEYLRYLFLDNDFAEHRFRVEGSEAAPTDLRMPIFALGATKDHVAPWKSVHKIHYLSNAEVTFALAEGGHNGGVVSPPGPKPRRYWISCTTPDAHDLEPEVWLERAHLRSGSWWEAWVDWLRRHSGAMAKPPPMRGAGGEEPSALPDAPGAYVMGH